jgi:shikimate dehydrogenase
LDRYAVIGNPVAHSRSPEIHALFAEQTGEPVEYLRLLAPMHAFAATVASLRASGAKGANITVPFKEQACALAARRSQRAEQAGAANILRFDAEGIFADNTDGVGLVRDVRDNCGVRLAGRRVLVIGAGGAARGVLAPLLDENPASVAVVNRTEARARALATQFPGIAVFALESLRGERFDVVINATSASLSGEAPPVEHVYGAGAFAYDMMYGAEPTPFMIQAAAEGARTADGLGMLVEQAAESFYLWRGIRPQTAAVLQALRKAM